MANSCGVVHAEQPSATLQRAGGTMHGVQLWINLPRGTRRYVVALPAGSGTVRVIAGSGFGVVSPLATQHPVDYYRIALAPQASLDVAVSPTATMLADPIAGTMHAGARAIERFELAIFRPGADSVRLQIEAPANSSSSCSRGAFVLSTRHEIEEMLEAYQSGRFGTIPALELAT